MARVSITDLQGHLDVSRDDVVSIACLALDAEGCPSGVEIALVDDATITELHLRYLGCREPTDVLTFPLEGSRAAGEEAAMAGASGTLGEIVISTERAVAQAPSYQQDPQLEVLLYVVHGVLHLLGYDDRSATERAAMERRQEEILERWRERRRRSPADGG